MIDFIIFFKDGHKQTLILKNESTGGPFLDSGEATHEFANAEDAQAHCLQDAFVVWDGKPIGPGLK